MEKLNCVKRKSIFEIRWLFMNALVNEIFRISQDHFSSPIASSFAVSAKKISWTFQKRG